MSGEIQRFQENVGTIEQVAANASLVRDLLKKVLRPDSKGDAVDGDYGTIPGCGAKLALHQPGAEKIGLLFNVRPDYEIQIIPIENATPGHREVRVKCNLVHRASGIVAGQGLASCATMEKKHRFKFGAEADPHDKWHTVEAVACKRAHTLAIRSLAACSDIFGDPPDDPAEIARDNFDSRDIPSGNQPKAKAAAPPPPKKDAPAKEAAKPKEQVKEVSGQVIETQKLCGKITGSRIQFTNAKGQKLVVVDVEGQPNLSTWSETLAAQANDGVGEMAEIEYREELGKDGRTYRRILGIQIIKG